MKKFSFLTAASSLTLLTITTTVSAAGFQLYEQGTPIIGTAAVGQTVVDDASSSYFNPACMGFIGDTELQLGSQLLSTETRFRANSLNTFTGGNGGNVGNWLGGLAIYGVTSCSDNLKLGFSLTSPFASTIQYNDGWIGRYFIQSAQFATLDANLALAYNQNECIAYGIGVFGEYAQLYERIGIPLSDPLEGQVDLRLRSFRPGILLGVLLTPCGESTRIGVTYRSAVHHKPRGRITFLRLPSSPTVQSNLSLPQSLIASLSQDLTEDFTLLAEVGWSNWSSFKNTSFEIDGITLPVRRNWKDTYRIGLAGQYILCENYLLQAGASYDSSPCNATTRLPDLPVDRQFRFGTGIVYTTLECVTFGLQYEFIDFGKARIHNSTRIGTLAGDYPKNFTNILSLSINFKF